MYIHIKLQYMYNVMQDYNALITQFVVIFHDYACLVYFSLFSAWTSLLTIFQSMPEIHKCNSYTLQSAAGFIYQSQSYQS